MHFSHPFDIVSFHDVMHMQGGYEWLLVLQPVQRSPKSNPSTWENPFATSLTLFLTTMPWSSCLLRNTHFIPMTLTSSGHSSSVQTSLQVKLFNSSCTAFIQSRSWRASSTFLGSIQETNDVEFDESNGSQRAHENLDDVGDEPLREAMKNILVGVFNHATDDDATLSI